MPELTVAHTADLDAATRDAVRALLDAAFGDFTDEDWEHSLGGVHAIVSDGGRPVAHAAVVARSLVAGRRALRTGYVEAVAVAGDRRGEGHGAAVMGVVERVIDRAYHLGALSTGRAARGFYQARGWRPWHGPTWALTPDGPVRTPDEDGGLLVRPVVEVDPAASLACDWRGGDAW